MGKARGGEGAAYDFDGFDRVCGQCGVSEQLKLEILKFFLYGEAPSSGLLLKHCASLRAFYAGLFLASGDAGEMDALRVVLKNCYGAGLRTVIDPACHIRSRAEWFMREYKNNKFVLFDPKLTNKLDAANRVQIENYGLMLLCPNRGGAYIIQRAEVTEFVYKAKTAAVAESAGGPKFLVRAATAVFKRRGPALAEAPEDRAGGPAGEIGGAGRLAEEPCPQPGSAIGSPERLYIPALKALTDTLARLGLTSSARMVKILLNNYHAVHNELRHAKNKREWLDEHYYIYTLLDNSAESAYKQLENAAGAHGDAVRRHEALKSLSAAKQAFVAVWDGCLRSLGQCGIRVLAVKAGSFVAPKNLKDGWEIRNTENRKADKEHPANRVYGVIQNGVTVESGLARKPILNVYTD